MTNSQSIRVGLLAAAVAAVLASLFAGTSAQASVTCSKYASPTGNDAAPGTLAAPFKSAQRLVESLQAGETGCLRQGTYAPTGTYVMSMARGGTESAPITVTSYPGEQATIKGITQIPYGDNYVTLSNMVFEGSAGMQTIGIYSTGVHIENNEISNNWNPGSCMMLGSNTYGRAVRPVISGNVFHACGAPSDGNKDHGIYAAGVTEGQIVNNLFYDIAAYAIQLYPNAQKTTFAHNVIDGSTPSVRGGLVFGGDETYASSENVVEQNVIAFAATYDVSTTWGGPVGSGNIASDNCLYGGQATVSNNGGMTASGNLTANPGFINAAADNFRLASNSPCLSTVGYDTVARIESDGVEVPAEGGSVGLPPAEGVPSEEVPTTPPVVEEPPVVTPPVGPPPVVRSPVKPLTVVMAPTHPRAGTGHGSAGKSGTGGKFKVGNAKSTARNTKAANRKRKLQRAARRAKAKASTAHAR